MNKENREINPRPRGWNAQDLARKENERQAEFGCQPGWADMVEVGADGILELLKIQGIKVVVSTTWLSTSKSFNRADMFELKEEGSWGIKIDSPLIKKICSLNNLSPTDLEGLEGYLVLLPAHTLKDST